MLKGPDPSNVQKAPKSDNAQTVRTLVIRSGPLEEKLAVGKHLMHYLKRGSWCNGYKLLEGYKYLKFGRFEDKRKV